MYRIYVYGPRITQSDVRDADHRSGPSDPWTPEHAFLNIIFVSMPVLCSSHHSRSKRKWALLSLGCHSNYLVAVPTTSSIFEPVAHVYTTPIGRKAYGPGLRHLWPPRYNSKTHRNTWSKGYIFSLETDDDDFLFIGPTATS
jgi:hypothetical protein